VVVVLVVIVLLLNHELDVWANPWAYASPPVLDHWAGDTTTGGGTRVNLDLTLARQPRPWWPPFGLGEPDDRDLDGRALLCDSTGRRQDYQIEGSVRDENGRHLLLMVQTPANEPAGVRFSSLRLEWDGHEELMASGWLQRVAETGSKLISTADPDIVRPVKVALRRATGKGASCG
jgi:hypothetical protein